MSDPRHAMVFQCDESKFWLNIVPTTETPSGDDSPLASETFGPFTSVRAFELMDVTGGDRDFSTSSAKGFFDANGVLETVDRTVTSCQDIQRLLMS